MALPELAGWRADSVRVTFIANSQVVAAGKNWWRAATGEEPEVITTKPQAAEHTESGPFLDGRLEMKASFNRIDWIYSPIITPGPTVPTIGEAEVVLRALDAPLARWLAIDETAYVRLALGPTVVREVADIAESNLAIHAYAPFLQVDAGAARDVLFQVNFPVASGVIEGLNINRVSKFMSATAQLINVVVGQPLPTIVTSYYCRAEFDINTAAEHTEVLPVPLRALLLRELTDCALGILRSGVQP